MKQRSRDGISTVVPVNRSLGHAGYRVEFVRQLEQQPALVSPAVIAEAEAGVQSDDAATPTFERMVEARANWLVALLRLDRLHARVDRAAAQSLWVFCLLFALLGAAAAAQGFDMAQQTVNFFWLLVVLLGVHTVALLFWLLTLLGQRLRTSAGKRPVLQLIALWLVRKFAGFFTHDETPPTPGSSRSESTVSLSAVGAVWARMHSRGRLGFWNFSLLSHAVWVAYLGGGLAMTLILLSLRQYDFVWATTVLSPGAFEQMTFVLGELPRLAGVPVPDAQLVQVSRTGVDVDPDTASAARVLWSNLLLSSLLIWGILPRAGLLMISIIGRKRALRHLAADFASPYYVGLRQHLLTGYRRRGIIDPDVRGGVSETNEGTVPAMTELPAQYDLASLYLDPQLPWPTIELKAAANLGCIDDAATEKAVMAAVLEARSPNLLLCSHLSTVPDRGVRRIIQGLKLNFRGRLYLGLLTPADRPADSHRLEDWYRLAAGIGISLDDLIQLPIRTDVHSDTRSVDGGGHHAV